MSKIFVSDAILEERFVTASGQNTLTTWGWKKLSRLYQESFAQVGFQVVPTLRPEIYHTEIARKIMNVERGDWHLAVKPLEHLRPFHGIPNIFVCNWPFSVLSSERFGISPFDHQRRLLEVANVIICCTGFTTQVLRQIGIKNALTLPPVITVPPPSRATHAASYVRHFISVIENEHVSLQTPSLIEGFGEAARHANMHLTLYVQGGYGESVVSLRNKAASRWPKEAPHFSDCVSVVGVAHGEELPTYAEGDFFLCTHIAPGLYLPLAEAMLMGLPLVTTLSGGSASFLTSEAVIPIPTERHPLTVEDEPMVRYLPIAGQTPTTSAVRDAILTAAALGSPAWRQLSEYGRGLADKEFGMAAFQSRLLQLGSLITREMP